MQVEVPAAGIATETGHVAVPARSHPDGIEVDKPVELALELRMLFANSDDMLEPDRLEVQTRTDALGPVDRRRTTQTERDHPRLVRLRRILAGGQELPELGRGVVRVGVIVLADRRPLLDRTLRVDRDLKHALLDLAERERTIPHDRKHLLDALGVIGPLLGDFDRQIDGHVLRQHSGEPEQLRTRCDLLVGHDVLLGYLLVRFYPTAGRP